jgi:hypothetical protein
MVPKVIGQMLIIPVKHLPLLGGHPLLASVEDKVFWKHPELGMVINGLLIFRGVSLSKRKLYEYVGDPRSSDVRFMEPYEIVDINVDMGGETLNAYEFEGGLEEPPSFVECWNVIARSFEFQVE